MMTLFYRAQTVVSVLTMLCLAGYSASASEVAKTPPAELPGVWCEFEAGGWHTDAKEHSGASGGKRVSWFDQDGRAVYMKFEVEKPMSDAIVFVRYSRALAGDSFIEVSFGPGSNPQDAKPLGKLRTARTGSWTRYRWISLPVGDLAAGDHYLIVNCRERRGAGDLDVAAVVPNDKQSRWMPPNEVKDGKFVGSGALLDGARPDDRMTEQALADIEAEKQRRAAEAASAAARRAHISDPANRLNIETTWFGNDIATGPDIPAWGGHTPHNIADIHVTPDGSLFTNVHWEEHGANVTEYKAGRWINSAHVGNHGGGRAVTANDTYLYFVGNRHRTGKEGIDRRSREDIRNHGWNVHVDLPGVRGLAATNDRVFAAIPGENTVKVFDADLKPLGSWDAPAPGKMTLDAQGHLWIILGGEPTIARFTQSGERLPQTITVPEGAEAAALAVDAQGRLLVGDGGPSEQVLIYQDIDTQPTLAERFGEPGGVYHGTAGRLGPKRFVRIVGVGADDSGNVYVASRPSNNGSTMLQSYSPEGELLWQKQCHIWLDCPAIHPDDPNLMLSSTARLRIDPEAPIGENWTAEALTVHHREFTDDFRHTSGGSGSTFLAKLSNGQTYQYLVNMLGKTTYIYRFDPENHGQVAIPAGFIDQSGVWVDHNGDGRRDAADSSGMTYQLTLRGEHREDGLHLTLTATDENNHRQSLTHRVDAANPGPRVSLGITAGGERRYDFSQFKLSVGGDEIATRFGSADGRDGEGGFSIGDEKWSVEEQALRVRGNRKGGKPQTFTASQTFDAMTQGKDFEAQTTVTAHRGRLYSDRMGLMVMGHDRDWRSGLGAVINVSGGYPILELRKGMSGDVIASKPLSDEVAGHNTLTTIGMAVDSEGSVWNATHGQGIYRYPIQGFTDADVPIYTVASREQYDTPENMNDLRRVYHYPDRGGLLLVNGFTKEHPNKNHHWKRAGKVIRAYENWTPGTPSDQWQLKWELVPPYEDQAGGNHGDGNIMSLDVAGDYLFVAREGQSGFLKVNRMHVDVYRLDDASYVGWMGPGEVAGDVGILDITHGMKAYQRNNGEYLIFLEDGAKARVLTYRWRP